MNKPHYGIDAPRAIKQLILSGFAALIVGVLAYIFLFENHKVLASIILGILLVLSVINFVFVLLMVWTSLFAKLRMRERIITHLRLQGDEKILDVGCGRGLLLHGIAKVLHRGGRAVGLDLWCCEDLFNNQQDLTRENAMLEGVSDRVQLCSGDMTQMSFPDNQFDIIVSSMAIHNVKTADKRHQAITEITRVLKPGGHLLILDFKYTRQYVLSLKQLGWDNIHISSYHFMMFPPVRIIRATSPLHHTVV